MIKFGQSYHPTSMPHPSLPKIQLWTHPLSDSQWPKPPAWNWYWPNDPSICNSTLSPHQKQALFCHVAQAKPKITWSALRAGWTSASTARNQPISSSSNPSDSRRCEWTNEALSSNPIIPNCWHCRQSAESWLSSALSLWNCFIFRQARPQGCGWYPIFGSFTAITLLSYMPNPDVRYFIPPAPHFMQ